MIITTTNTIEGKTITSYLGIVTGTHYSAGFDGKGMSFKDYFSSKKYYNAYEKALEEAKENAFQKLKENATKLKANAIVGVSVDIESMSHSSNLMISVVGTAVVVV